MASSPIDPTASVLQAEIRQTRPFHSLQQEALLSVQRTASLVERQMSRLLDREGLSTAQYNVLRILRGAGEEGLPTLAIRSRMIDPGAAITRLIDRLEMAGFASRERGSDRRMVHCRVTPAGLEVLRRLDPQVVQLEQELAGEVPPEELRTLIDLLVHLRAAACDGQLDSGAGA
jgi:MarR family transcriptional regulator, organic hydroperoxide resistance regulator